VKIAIVPPAQIRHLGVSDSLAGHRLNAEPEYTNEVMDGIEESRIWQPSPERAQQVKEFSLSPSQFAELTGANIGFTPAHPNESMIFWKEDICEKDEFHTEFPHLSLSEAQQLWVAMEDHLLSRYGEFLRLWPEWCSSGIWSVPYPGSRRAGGMVDYQYLPLPGDLVDRFKAW
jgi:hypothetical protein